MAVSSSIGSNIFDVAVGLPLPWLLFGISYCPICVSTSGVVPSLLILIGMVFCVIMLIAGSGWKMTKNLGGFMFFLYFGYCVEEILRMMVFSSEKGC